MSRPFSSLSYTIAVVALSLAATAAQAQSVITVYQNNFETPATTACAGGLGNPQGGLSSDYSTPAHPFAQIYSADRVCISAVDDGRSIVDPAGKGGRYSGGMVASPSQSWIEAWSLQFDPQGYNFLNIQLDWSLVDIPIEPRYTPSTPRNVVTRFYRVPAGASFGLLNGGNQPAKVTVNGSPAVAFSQTSFTINPLPAADYPAKRYTLNWQPQTLSVDLTGQGFQPGDKVAVVNYLEGDYTYAAFDNFLVTASVNAGGQTPAVPVPANGLAMLVLSSLGLLAGARRWLR